VCFERHIRVGVRGFIRCGGAALSGVRMRKSPRPFPRALSSKPTAMGLGVVTSSKLCARSLASPAERGGRPSSRITSRCLRPHPRQGCRGRSGSALGPGCRTALRGSCGDGQRAGVPESFPMRGKSCRLRVAQDLAPTLTVMHGRAVAWFAPFAINCSTSTLGETEPCISVLTSSRRH